MSGRPLAEDDLREQSEAAEEFLRRDSVQRAWARGLGLFVISFATAVCLGVIPVIAESIVGVRDTDQSMQDELAARLSWMSGPISESAVVVLPAMLAAVLALAVVNAVGKVGPRFVIATANTATWLATVWTLFAVYAVADPPASMETGGAARALAACALTVVVVAVNILLSEMSSMADITRAESRRKWLQTLSGQLHHVATSQITQRVYRRYGPSPSVVGARWSIRLWYLISLGFAASSAYLVTLGRSELFPGLLVIFAVLSGLTLFMWRTVLRAVFAGTAETSFDEQVGHARRFWWLACAIAGLGIGIALNALGHTSVRLWVVGVGLYITGLLIISLSAYLPLVRDPRGRGAIARLVLLLLRAELESQIAALEAYTSAAAATNAPQGSTPAVATKRPRWWGRIHPKRAVPDNR